ncbi:MAG: hypothetical protein HY270_00900 [Deltaproteobacteria bacterium]|nr:hypothetical protein [Deltaproteobacteria bacterium]
MNAQSVNLTRYQSGQRAGHYESFFLRANDPHRPLAFWIRYTLFSPQAHPERAIGELWAVCFDGESGKHVAAKTEVPIDRCRFSNQSFDVQVGDAQLGDGHLHGGAASSGHRIDWRLRFAGGAAPVFLLPQRMYEASLPKAKSLVSLPLARFDGELIVDGTKLDVANWIGSQNHNWGSKHTDLYAWGQVCGFDDHPDSFLEVATARLKLGPLWTPPMTPMVLRHRGKEHVLNDLGKTFHATGEFSYFTWRFESENETVRIEGRIHAAPQAFVGLRYYNPPGGIKHCLNSKLASCDVRLSDRSSGNTEVLRTANRAAFEILTDDVQHGIELRA